MQTSTGKKMAGECGELPLHFQEKKECKDRYAVRAFGRGCGPMSAGAPEGIVTKASPFSVEETLSRLEAAIRERGLTLFARIAHSEEARRAGLAMQPAHVLIFGSPKAGTPLMVAAPLLALDLPLRVLVWQDGAGKVWASYYAPLYLAARFGLSNALIKNIAGIEALVESAIHG